jgi:hypothetical protein
LLYLAPLKLIKNVSKGVNGLVVADVKGDISRQRPSKLNSKNKGGAMNSGYLRDAIAYGGEELFVVYKQITATIRSS